MFFSWLVLAIFALGLFFILIALRIIPIFASTDSWIFFVVGGIVFTVGIFMIIFNLTPRE